MAVVVDIITNLKEQGIQDTIDKVGQLQNVVDKYKDSISAEENGDNVFNYMSETLTNLGTVLTTFKDTFANTGIEMGRAMAVPFTSMQKTIANLEETIGKYAKNGAGAGLANKAVQQMVGLDEAYSYISKINDAASRKMTLNGADFSSTMPLLMNRIINSKVKELSEGVFLRSNASVRDYAGQLAKDADVTSAYKAVTGVKKINEEQLRNEIEMSLLLHNRRSLASMGLGAVSRAPIQRTDPTFRSYEIVPDRFVDAYLHRGRVSEDVQKEFQSNLPLANRKGFISNDVYKQLRDYVEQEDEGSNLHKILEAAQIMRISNGRRQWAKNLSVQQASYLGGLSARDLYDARRGYAFYDVDPANFAEDARVDRRMNARVRANLKLEDILSQDPRVTPMVSLTPKKWVLANGQLFNPNDHTQWTPEDTNISIPTRTSHIRSNNYVKGVPVSDQFIVPRTMIDPSTGELIVRDSTWKKKTGFDVETADDQFVVATDSPLMEIMKDLKLPGKRTGRTFGVGHGTFGYGRDDNGNPVYDTPPLLKIDPSNFITTDEKGNPTITPENEKRLRNLVSGKGYSYDGSNYSYAYQGDNALYFVEERYRKGISDWFKQRHVPDFFEGMNAQGLESVPKDKLVKMINGMKKGASTSLPYEEVFGKFSRPFDTRIMNLEALYDAIGEGGGKPFRIDGAAFGSSDIFKNGPVQMRSASGFAKYVLNPYNFEKLFGDVLGAANIDMSKVTSQAYGNNWMVSKDQGGNLQYWLPGISATKEEIQHLMRGDLDPKDLQALRDNKFFNALDKNLGLILPDSAVKNQEKFGLLGAQDYLDVYGASALEEARKQGRYTAGPNYDKAHPSGYVNLNPKEQGELHDRATKDFMVMRSAYDFANDPTIMSQQVAASIGITRSQMQQSDAEFERRRYKLRTAEGRMEALRANPFYERKLDQDPSFAYSNAANSYIESQIRALYSKQRSGYIAAPDTLDIRNRVAGLNPGALMEPLLRSLNVNLEDENLNPLMKAILPYAVDKNNQVFTSPEILKQNVEAMLTRNPSAPGQEIFVTNAAAEDPEVLKYFKEMTGLNDDQLKQVIFGTPNQLYQQNTGDFDGDVVSMYVGLEESQINKAKAIKAEIEKAGYSVNKDNEIIGNSGKTILPEDIPDARIKGLLQYMKSTQQMGSASKLIREAMNLNENDPRKWRLAAQGMWLYDKASSEVRTKGEEVSIPEEAMPLITGGNSYQRFIRRLNVSSGMDSTDANAAVENKETIKSLLKSKLPTMSDPQGVMTALLAQDTLLHGGDSDYSDFEKEVDRMLYNEFGDSLDPEAKATKWYAGLMKRSISGRLLSQSDVDTGTTYAREWLDSINARGFQNVSKDELSQYQRLLSRIDEIRSPEAMTKENLISKRNDLLRKASAPGVSEDETDEYIAEMNLITQALENDDKYEQKQIDLDRQQAKTRKTQRDQRIAGRAQTEQSLAAARQTQDKSYWDKAALNWSNSKDWLDKTYTFDIMRFAGDSAEPTKGEFATVSFAGPRQKEHQRVVAANEIRGKGEDTIHTIIGNIMHGAFRQYFEAAGNGTLEPGQTVDDFFETVLGSDNSDNSYRSFLEKNGYHIQNVAEKGQKPRYKITKAGSTHDTDTALLKLEKILPTESGEPSETANFVSRLQKEGFVTNKPVNVEGNYFYNPESDQIEKVKGENYGFAANVPGAKPEHQGKTTFARPDLMLYHPGDKNHRKGMYIVDYKSRYEGAMESLLQSAFYTSLYDKAAEKYWREMEKTGGRDSDIIAQTQQFARAGHLEDAIDAGGNKIRKYVSDIQGVIGFDPRNAQHILAARYGSARNQKIFDTIGEDVTQAWVKKYAAANDLSEESVYVQAAAALKGDLQAAAKEEQQRIFKESVSSKAEEFTKAGNQKIIDYFLNQYQPDIETITQARSSAYAAMKLPQRKYNKFSSMRESVQNALNEDVVAAVKAEYGADSPQYKDIESKMQMKGSVLDLIDQASFRSSVSDWEELGVSARNMLTGAKNSQAQSTLSAINDRIRQARTAREDLKNKTIAVQEGEGDNKTTKTYQLYTAQRDENGRFLDKNLSAKEQAELFDTTNQNSEIAIQAANYKIQFLKSIQAEEDAMASIKESSESFFKHDKAQQDQSWNNIIGKIKNPEETLQDAFTQKRANVTAMINSWNSDIESMQKEINNNETDEEMKPFYEALIKDRQDRIAKAETFARSSELSRSVIQEQKERLGMTTKSPKERADEWLRQRNAVLLAEAQLDYDREFKQLDWLSTEYDQKQNPAALESLIGQQERVNEIQNRINDLKAGNSEYTPQAKMFEEMLTRQQTEAYNNFENRALGIAPTRDDLIRSQIDQMKDYALNQSMSKELSNEAREQWAKLLTNTDFWDKAVGEIRQNYENQDAYGQAQRDASARATQMRRDYSLQQMQQSDADFYRQQRNQYYNRTFLGRTLAPINERRIQLSRQLEDNGYYAQERQRLTDAQNLARMRRDNYKGTDAGEKAQLEFNFNEASKDLENLAAREQEAQSELENLNKTATSAQAVFTALGGAVGQLATRFGRQLFQKALQETKRFVQEYDASMTEIQAITMKSDEEMQTVRGDTINRALGLRTSVSNVATTEAALYRQGLSDDEIGNRTESIIKFATVTKLNVTEATKIITTALQNDLVSSAEQAMDAMVALGDSAATTAAEIGKGMQKAAASAKVAGVSYAELTALLTIGTADTQLSGTQVGTALQTVFSRMRRLSLSGYTADQNGEKTTASDAEAALASVGVDLWDDKYVGKMRSAYEVMSDLSKVWQNLSDAQKSIVTNSLAGTRQTNVFSTLMEGMSEDGGAVLDKYLGLASDSAGVTQSKYEIAMQSLAASMDTLRSSWDAVVESFVNGGTITGPLDGVSSLLQTIAGISSQGGQIGIVFSAIAGGITALVTACLAAKTAVAPISTLLSIIAGLAVGGIGIAAVGGLQNLFKTETDSERLARVQQEKLGQAQESNDIISGNAKGRSSLVDEVEKLGKAYDKLKESGSDAEKAVAGANLVNSLNNLKAVFPEIADEIMNATNNLDGWKNAVEAANTASQEYSRKGVVSQAQNIAFAHSDEGVAQQGYYDYMKQNVVDEDKADYLNYLLATKGTHDFDWRNDYLDENGQFSLDLFKETGTDFQKSQMLNQFLSEISGTEASAVTGFLSASNQGVLNNFNKNEGLDLANEENLDDYASAFDDLVTQIETAQDGADYTQKQTAAVDQYVGKLVTDYSAVFDSMATEGFSAGDIQTMLLRDLKEKMYENGEENAEFFDENGLITGAVDAYVQGFIGRWAQNGTEELATLFKNNKKPSEYEYHIGEFGTDSFVGFNTYDEAIEYIRQNGLSYNDLLTKDNKAGYQSSEKTVNALIESLNQDKTNENFLDFLQRARQATSIRELKDLYDRNGESGVLSSVLSSNPELLSMYRMTRSGTLDYSDFLSAAEKMQVGRSSAGDVFNAVWNEILADSSFADTLRTDSAYSGAYKVFQSYVGDIADEILNAAVDGLDSADSGLMKEFNKQVASQRIKEQFQFSEGYEAARNYALTAMYGTAEEKRAQTAQTKQTQVSYAEYEAAVTRFLNGNAKESDYGLIASNSAYSENELRNGLNRPEINTALSRERTQQQASMVQQQQLALEMMLAANGLAYEDVLNPGRTWTKDEYEKFIARTNIKPTDTAAVRSTRQSLANFDNWDDAQFNDFMLNVMGINPALSDNVGKITETKSFLGNRMALSQRFPEIFDYIASLEGAGYTVGQNGISYTSSQGRLTPEAINRSYLQQNREGSMLPYLQAITENALITEITSQNITDYMKANGLQGVQNYKLLQSAPGAVLNWKNRDVVGRLSSVLGEDYETAMSNDEMLRAMVLGGASLEDIVGYASRATSGKRGTFAENYGWAMDKVFGGNLMDWTSLSEEELANSVAQAQERFASIRTNPEQWPIYEQMFSSMAGGDQWLKILSGEGGNIQEALAAYVESYVSSLVNNGLTSEQAQRAAQNQATLLTGETTARLGVYSQYTSGIKQLSNAMYGVSGANTAENRAYISSLLGLSDDDVKRMMSSEEGTAELQQAITEKTKGLYQELATSFGATLTEGFDFDTASLEEVKSELQNAIDSVPEELQGMFKWLIDLIDGITVPTNPEDFGSAYESAMESFSKERTTQTGYSWLIDNWNTISGNVKRGIRDNNGTVHTVGQYDNIVDSMAAQAQRSGINWSTFLSSNPTVASAINAYGRNGFGDKEMMTIFDYGLTGRTKDSNYYKLLSRTLFGDQFVGANGNFNINSSNIDQFKEVYDELNTNESGLALWLDELIAKFPQLNDIIAGSTDAVENLNNQMGEEAASEVTKYSKGVDGLSSILAGFTKGGKDAANASATLKKQLNNLQDQAKAVSKAQNKDGTYKSGKSLDTQTRNIIASMFGLDANDIKKKSAEELADMLAPSQDYFNDVYSNYIQGLLDQVQITDPTLDMGKVKAIINGEMDLSELEGTVSDTAMDILAKILELQKTYGSITLETDENGNVVSVKGVFDKGSGGGYHSSGGGGGGGKSAAQKAINQAKNDASMAEHYVNMAQEVQNQYKYEGNFEGLKQAIDEERQALEAQLGVYINNIQELEEAQAGVKEYSDDWYSLQDAIDDAKESAIKCSNAIAELMEKDISAIQSEYDRPESEETHEMNMLTSQMEQAELNGDSELYESLSEQKKQLISEMQETNDEQIANYDALIEEYTKQGVDTLALEKERWALEEENEELRTQALQEEQNAIEKLASIAQKNASNQTMSDEHEVNMAQTYASVYQKAGDHQNYRNQLQNQITAWQKMVVVQKQSLAAEKAILATIEAGTKEYYKQLAVVYEIEEKIAQYEANIASAELDIEADIVDEMLENYKREVDIYDHIRTLANDRKEMYKNRGSDEAYDIMLEKERGIVQAQLEANKEWEKTLKSQLAQTTYNSDAWWSLYDQILNVEKAISSAEVELENWDRELEKLKIDRWFEDWDRMQTQREHNLKNAQYEQTRLKNLGQYTDYGTVLEYENELRQENIDILKEQIATLEEEITNENLSEADFYRVADAIHKKSEAVRSDTNEIEKNTKALAENRETIRKTQTTLQNMVLQVIKDNKQREEDMLSARIKLEGYILDAIKARYVEEWDFIKETYNRQKEALNQEKELINERLNFRKQAADEEDQYEQLRALERQYALISADPTRSKEANELSRQIADLRENISWSRASEEAAYATERIEDELQAIEDFLTIGQERLNEMLENANNFATEVNEIMGRSMTEIVAWLQENNEMYKNSLTDSQIQMTEAWEQTWKDMMGITDTYWDEIAQITSDKTTFINWMMENSVDYLNASLEGQMSYIYQWETAYENAARAIVQEIATIADAYEQLYDTIYNWENPNAAADAAEAEAWDYDYSWADAGTAFEMGSTEDDTTAAAAAQQTAEEQTQVVEPGTDDDKTKTEDGDGGGSGGTNGHKYKATVQIYKPGEGMKDVTGYGVGNTEEAAKKIALQYANSKIPEGYTDTNLKFEKIYKEGGYVDFTGPAWVDGTPSRPEAFLDADDTEMVRSLLDAFSYVRVESMHPNLDEITNSTGASSIGDIYITLNEAKLESDADYEEVAQKVGRAFTKELTSKGFNLANYSF